MPTTKSWAGGCPLGAWIRQTRKVEAPTESPGEEELSVGEAGDKRSLEAARNRSAQGALGAAGTWRPVPSWQGAPHCQARKARWGSTREAEAEACVVRSGAPRTARGATRGAEAAASRSVGRCPSPERPAPTPTARRASKAWSWVGSSRIRRGPRCWGRSPWPVLLHPGAIAPGKVAAKVRLLRTRYRGATSTARNFVGVDRWEWTARDRKSTPWLSSLRSDANCSRRLQPGPFWSRILLADAAVGTKVRASGWYSSPLHA